MSRYIDAEAYKAAHKNAYETAMMECGNGDDTKLARRVYEAVIKSVDVFPAADVVEVVRCKDCKYQNKGQNECESWNICEYRSWLYFPVNDDDYCSNGERRNE